MADKNRNDKIFKMLAKKYVEAEGSRIDQEVYSEPVKSMPFPKTSIKDIKKKASKKNIMVQITAIAAVLVVAAAIGIRVIYNSKDSTSDAPFAPAPSGNSAVQTSAPVIKWEAPKISLVSERFEIFDSLEDTGSVTYRIRDIYGYDDAVITVADASLLDLTEEQYDALSKGRVYRIADFGYKLMMYKSHDSVITLTCRYSNDTLNELNDGLRISF